uniref:G_PROTEIN_RECEP_F3_4 domain-containing protein n=1 Tax=Heterorhabditis bacteriophora TaxID=37862 RepID=A0A1I7XC19_HETBA
MDVLENTLSDAQTGRSTFPTEIVTYLRNIDSLLQRSSSYGAQLFLSALCRLKHRHLTDLMFTGCSSRTMEKLVYAMAPIKNDDQIELINKIVGLVCDNWKDAVCNQHAAFLIRCLARVLCGLPPKNAHCSLVVQDVIEADKIVNAGKSSMFVKTALENTGKDGEHIHVGWRGKNSSRIWEKVVASCSEESRRLLWKAVASGSISDIAFHPSANFPLQRLISSIKSFELVSTKTEFLINVITLNSYDGKHFDVEKCQLQGGLILEALFSFTKLKTLSACLEALTPQDVLRLAKNRCGSHVLQAAFESRTLADTVKFKLIDAFEGHWETLISDMYGSHVFESVWDCSLFNVQRQQELLKNLLPIHNSSKFWRFAMLRCDLNLFRKSRKEWVVKMKTLKAKCVADHQCLDVFEAVRKKHLACLCKYSTTALLIKDQFGQTILHYAVKTSDFTIINKLLSSNVHCRYLVERFPSLKGQPSCNGETPVLIAAAQGDMNVVEVMLAGPLRDAIRIALHRDINGTSVLMACVAKGDNHIALWLLKKFGKTLAMLPNNSRMLPLHVAAAQDMYLFQLYILLFLNLSNVIFLKIIKTANFKYIYITFRIDFFDVFFSFYISLHVKFRISFSLRSLFFVLVVAVTIVSYMAYVNVLCLGLIQSLFEGSMYTFVLEWTPALTQAVGENEYIPHGYIFAAFMVAMMIGSSIFKIISRNSQPEDFMRGDPFYHYQSIQNTSQYYRYLHPSPELFNIGYFQVLCVILGNGCIGSTRYVQYFSLHHFQIGGSFPLHDDDCQRLRPDTVQEIVAIQWALTHWNQNPANFNSKLGLYAGDTCSRSREALSQSLRFLDSVGYHEPIECRTDTPIAKLLGLIAPKDYNSSLSLGTILTVSDLPVASYSSEGVSALVELNVENVISTTLTMGVYVEALVRIMASLRSNLVTIVDDGTNSEQIRRVIEQLRLSEIYVSETVSMDHPYLAQALEDSDSDIIVSLLNKQQIISLQPHFKELPQFRDYFLRVLKNNYRSYQLLTSYVQQVYNCTADSCDMDKHALMKQYRQARTAEAVIRMTYAFAAVGASIGADSEKDKICAHPSAECTALIMDEFLALDYVFSINDPSELSGERLQFYRGSENILLASGMMLEAIELFNDDEKGLMVYRLLTYITGVQPTVTISSIRPADQRLRSICSPYRPFCGQCPNVQIVNGEKHFLSIPRHYPMYVIGLFDIHSGASCQSMRNTDISLPMAFVHTLEGTLPSFQDLYLDPESLSAFRHFERLAVDRGVCLAEVVNIGGVTDNLPIGISTNVTVVPFFQRFRSRMTKSGYLARGVERFLFAMDSKLCPAQSGLCIEFYEKGRRQILNLLKKTNVEDDIEIYEYLPVGNGLELSIDNSFYNKFMHNHLLILVFFKETLLVYGDFLQMVNDVISGSYVKKQPAFGAEIVSYPSVFEHLSLGKWRSRPHNFVLLALITVLVVMAVAVLILVLVKLYLRVVKGNQSLGISLLVGIITLYITAYFFIFDATDSAFKSLKVNLHDGLQVSFSWETFILQIVYILYHSDIFNIISYIQYLISSITSFFLTGDKVVVRICISETVIVCELIVCASILLGFLFGPKIYILLSYEPVVVEFKPEPIPNLHDIGLFEKGHRTASTYSGHQMSQVASSASSGNYSDDQVQIRDIVPLISVFFRYILNYCYFQMSVFPEVAVIKNPLKAGTYKPRTCKSDRVQQIP